MITIRCFVAIIALLAFSNSLAQISEQTYSLRGIFFLPLGNIATAPLPTSNRLNCSFASAIGYHASYLSPTVPRVLVGPEFSYKISDILGVSWSALSTIGPIKYEIEYAYLYYKKLELLNTVNSYDPFYMERKAVKERFGPRARGFLNPSRSTTEVNVGLDGGGLAPMPAGPVSGRSATVSVVQEVANLALVLVGRAPGNPAGATSPPFEPRRNWSPNRRIMQWFIGDSDSVSLNNAKELLGVDENGFVDLANYLNTHFYQNAPSNVSVASVVLRTILAVSEMSKALDRPIPAIADWRSWIGLNSGSPAVLTALDSLDDLFQNAKREPTLDRLCVLLDQVGDTLEVLVNPEGEELRASKFTTTVSLSMIAFPMLGLRCNLYSSPSFSAEMTTFIGAGFWIVACNSDKGLGSLMPNRYRGDYSQCISQGIGVAPAGTIGFSCNLAVSNYMSIGASIGYSYFGLPKAKLQISDLTPDGRQLREVDSVLDVGSAFHGLFFSIDLTSSF